MFTIYAQTHSDMNIKSKQVLLKSTQEIQLISRKIKVLYKDKKESLKKLILSQEYCR